MTQLSLSSLDDTVELQGTLERVVFHNEENGYTVFRVRPEGKDEVDLVTVVGHMGSPQAGASLRIKGRWVNNARFGRQVQMDSFESLLPATAEGIKLYLASGLIKGIGKSIAARIVKAFGEDTLRIFDEEPQRLLEISGITQKKLVTIVECWTSIRACAIWCSSSSRTIAGAFRPSAFISITVRRRCPSCAENSTGWRWTSGASAS